MIAMMLLAATGLTWTPFVLLLGTQLRVSDPLWLPAGLPMRNSNLLHLRGVFATFARAFFTLRGAPSFRTTAPQGQFECELDTGVGPFASVCPPREAT